MTPNIGSPADRTNFVQSLMHLLKSNLGTGMLAMPASFAHAGLVNAAIGLPLLGLVAGYCVHLLVRCSRHLEIRMKLETNLDYAALAKSSFKTGPAWMRPFSNSMCKLVDGVLLLCQLGICCVYIVFIVDNVKSILDTYSIRVNPNYLFLALMPALLLLSYVRTLRRLAIASACANLLQVVGICIILDYLIRDCPSEPKVELFKPPSEVALAFGSAIFAFEGISVVLPVYTRMKRREQMGGLVGVINVSFSVLLFLYTLIGVFGYLRFGSAAHGSITLNLPKEPFYDVVRAIFTVSLFLTYPLQFYAPQEIIWKWASGKLSSSKESRGKGDGVNGNFDEDYYNEGMDNSLKAPSKDLLVYEYLCRTLIVLFTFVLALSVPKLNLMMDFFGSISGAALSVTLPPIIHLATFWEDTSGVSRAFMVLVDGAIVLFGVLASASGSYFSFIEIVHSFGEQIPVTFEMERAEKL